MDFLLHMHDLQNELSISSSFFLHFAQNNHLCIIYVQWEEISSCSQKNTLERKK